MNETQQTELSGIARSMLRLATWKVWLASAALFLVFAGVFFGSSTPFAVGTVETLCGDAPLDVRFTSTAAEVHSFLEACGPAGRDSYRNMQIADLFYPMVFGLFMASSLASVFKVLRKPRLVVVGSLGFLGAGFDYLENIFAWRALWAYPGTANTNGLLGLASAAKTATFWTAGVVLLVGFAWMLLQAIRGRGRGDGIRPDGWANVPVGEQPNRQHALATLGVREVW